MNENRARALLDGREEKKQSMPAYFFVDIREIKDAVRGEQFEVVEGTYHPVRLAMLEFPTMHQARRWYDSKEYREIKRLCLAATVSNGFFMTGA